jgi:uncharacterized protein (DUF1697 family)
MKRERENVQMCRRKSEKKLNVDAAASAVKSKPVTCDAENITWAVLLRGVNCGGNIIKMVELRDLLSNELGFDNVVTYIQSGNCIFKTKAGRSASYIRSSISSGIIERFGFEAEVFVLTLEELQRSVDKNPFADVADAKRLHFFFFPNSCTDSDIDWDCLTELATDTEKYKLVESVFYLLTPDGFGRSKLVAKIDKAILFKKTARNYRSVSKILSLALALGPR